MASRPPTPLFGKQIGMQLGLLGSRCAACVILLALAPGCQERSAPPPGAQTALDLNTTPEAQLRNVERRMKDALERARAASGTGVRSMRTCEFHLIPPGGDNKPYTAEVVIATSAELNPEDLKQGTRGKPNLKPIGEAAEDLADETAQTTRRTYKLTYRDQHWELTDPQVEEIPEVDQTCFKIALSDG
jgi:hypothetical protein